MAEKTKPKKSEKANIHVTGMTCAAISNILVSS